MKYAMDARADGTFFETEPFTQRVGPLAGDHHEAAADEVVYVLEGQGRVNVGGEAHEVREGVAVFVSRGTPWSAEGTAERQAWVADLAYEGLFGTKGSKSFARSPDWRTEADRILAAVRAKKQAS